MTQIYSSAAAWGEQEAAEDALKLTKSVESSETQLRETL